MATNGDDYIEPRGNCAKAWIYCGVQNQLYPDSRPMGYPFDRPIGLRSESCGRDYGSMWYKVCKAFGIVGVERGVKFMEDWVDGVGNMGWGEVVIKHGKMKK